MPGESTQQKTSPTLAQVAARDHSEMLRNALNFDPAKAVREALAFDPAKALAFDPAKAVREALAFDPAKALAFDPAKAVREALAFDPAKAMQRALSTNPYEAIYKAISNLEVYEQPVARTTGFLEDLNVDVPELFEYIDEQLETAAIDADAFLFEPEADEHPAVLAIWEYVARFDSWARTKFEKHSDTTIRKIEGIAATCIYAFLVSLIPFLSVTFGPPGFFLGILLFGIAKYVDDSRKAGLKPQVREGLGVICPTCGAFPDMWCVTIKGNNPGTSAQSLHRPRLKHQ